MLFVSSKNVSTPHDLLRLYMHEAERTYSDKLINQEDLNLFHKILKETIRKNFEVDEIVSFVFSNEMKDNRLN